MEGERRGGWAYRHADAYVHELADGTHTPRFRPYYITFYWLSSPWREQKERCERKGDEARSEKKKLASLHRESALIKAPFYTFRWHQGITSVSRYFFFFSSSPPILFPFAPFFFSPSRFFLFRFFLLFSFVYLSFFFPLLFPWDQRHAGYEIKGKREREGGAVEFRNDAVCVGLFRTNSRVWMYRVWAISSVERNLIITR